MTRCRRVGDTVGQIDRDTGAVYGTFSLPPDFHVGPGDLDVCQSTGAMFVVKDSTDTIAELSPEGAFVRAYPLPPGVTELSGIGIDDGVPGEAWVSSRNGTVSRLAGLPCAAP